MQLTSSGMMQRLDDRVEKLLVRTSHWMDSDVEIHEVGSSDGMFRSSESSAWELWTSHCNVQRLPVGNAAYSIIAMYCPCISAPSGSANPDGKCVIWCSHKEVTPNANHINCMYSPLDLWVVLVRRDQTI